MKMNTFADKKNVACTVNCWLKDTTSKVILQQHRSIGETLKQVHFSFRKVCLKAANMMHISFI